MTFGSKSQARPDPQTAEGHVLLDAARSRVLRRLAGTLRHDLNSPLQAAVWAFDLVERGIATHPDEQQRAKIATSVDLGRRELARLQNTVRLFVACAAPLDEMRESFDLREVLGEIERLVAAEASLRDVHLTFKPQAEPLGMNGVRYQLREALLLLTLEALDGAGHGGSVEVEPSQLSAGLQVHFSHAISGAAPAARDDAADLAERAVEAVAASHGGKVSRQDSPGRRDVLFEVARG